ncbi:MAG: hypothetical protein R2939_18395 [Kofleriaceae bacterium]
MAPPSTPSDDRGDAPEPGILAVAACAALAASACTGRAVPYRFPGALLGGARLPTLPERVAEVDPPATSPGRPSRSQLTTSAPPVGPSSEMVRITEAGELLVGHVDDDVPDAAGVVWSRLPAPHRAPAGAALASLEGVTGVDDLRQRTGQRDPAPPIAWAWRAAHALGATTDASGPGTGADLLAQARAADTLAAKADVGTTARPGDLLVFDRAVAGAPASLIAVVLGVSDDGVVEMMYLGGGVVRRGVVDPTRASTRRDDAGRSINTYLRHNRDWPPRGTRFLAGELLAHHVRLAPR